MKKYLFTLLLSCILINISNLSAQTAIKFKNNGNAALRAKDFKQALVNYEKFMVAKDSWEDFALVFNSAYCAVKVKDFAKAERYFSMSIENKYKLESSYRFKAFAQKKQYKFNEMVATLQAGIIACPNKKSKMESMLEKHYLLEGLKAQKTNKPEIAESLYKEAIVELGKAKTIAPERADIGKVIKDVTVSATHFNVSEEEIPEKKTLEQEEIEFRRKLKSLLENYLEKTDYSIESIFKGSEPKEMIQKYVDYKVKLWQQKGEFEKTENYLKRIEKRDEYINTCKDTAELIVNRMWIIKTDWNTNRIISRYDADSETFKITFQNYRPIILKVPIAEAKSFKTNFEDFSQNIVADAKFNYINGEWGISYLELLLKDPESYKRYTYDVSTSKEYNPTKITYNFDEINIELDNIKKKIQTTDNLQKISVGKSDVDIDIPVSTKKKLYTYALIVGNEDYSTHQPTLEKEANVPYAVNDALVFSKYLNQTFGVPKENITVLTNATGNEILQNVDKLSKLAKHSGGKGKIIFYYAGHGLPHQETKEQYLIPVDVSGANVEYGINMNDIYTKLAEYSSKRVLVFLDACFSGGARNIPLIASRGIKVVPKSGYLKGNMLVFSSSSGNQVSSAWQEKQHGLFTYFLLKKIKDTKGNVSLKELSDYLQENIPLKAIKINKPEQVPVVKSSMKIERLWHDWWF